MTARGLAVMAALVAMGLLAVIASCAQPANPEAVEVTVKRTQCAIDTYTDAATGCAFLRSTCGGLTPRLDPTGRPLCRPLNPGLAPTSGGQ